MSKFTSLWTYLTQVGDALVDSGDFDFCYKQKLPRQLPFTHKKVLVINVESEEDLDDSSEGLLLWKGVYGFTILRNSFGADAAAVDEFIGTASDAGPGALADTTIKTLETNIKSLGSTCVYRFSKVEYGQRDQEPRLAATFTLEVEGPLSAGIRGGSVTGGITVVAEGTVLNDLADVNAGSPSDNDALTWDAATSRWVPEAVAGGGSHVHATTDITDFEADVSGIVTFESLDANGDVGAGAGQVASGVHTHLEADITDFGSYLENVVEDTTPELGGHLDALGNNAVNLGHLQFNSAGSIVGETTTPASGIYGNFLSFGDKTTLTTPSTFNPAILDYSQFLANKTLDGLRIISENRSVDVNAGCRGLYIKTIPWSANPGTGTGVEVDLDDANAPAAAIVAPKFVYSHTWDNKNPSQDAGLSIILLGTGIARPDNLIAGTFKAIGADNVNIALRTLQGDAVFNEDGVDSDFRVESTNEEYMLWVDASLDAVGINKSTLNSAYDLDVSGIVNADDGMNVKVGSQYQIGGAQHTHLEADVTDLQSYLTDITGQSIENLSDVDSSMSPSTDQVLTWDGGKWTSDDVPAGSGSGATELDELTDVTITAAAVGDILRHNGSQWVDVLGADFFSPSGHNHDADYAAISHAHITGDITDFESDVSGFVTYEVLDANSDVGTSAGQLAIGDHNHDASYSPLGHAHVTGDITAFSSEVSGHVTYESLDANSDVGTGATQVAQGDHNHDGTYSPVGHAHVTGDITAFGAGVSGFVTYEVLDANSDVGTSAGQLAIGDHNHDSDYAALSHVHATTDITSFEPEVSGMVTYESLSANSDIGTGATQVAQGDHTQAVAKGGTNLASGTSGGILGFTAAGTIASSALLAASQLVLGGGAGATPTTLAAGTDNYILRMGASNPGYEQEVLSKSIAIEDPTTADDLTFFFTPVAITVTQVRICIVGSSTPSWTADIRHHTSRNNAGNALISSPTASTEAGNNAESTGHNITSFDDGTIPANSFVWVETDAVGGTLDQGAITLRYTID
jgi:hypothetical protein